MGREGVIWHEVRRKRVVAWGEARWGGKGRCGMGCEEMRWAGAKGDGAEGLERNALTWKGIERAIPRTKE